jgi:septal ring factor EnvC (AmiA/AmiB activator)
MSIKAEVVSLETIATQTKELQAQKASLETKVDVLDRKIENIKASLAENEDLKKKNQELLEQVLKLFDEEWSRRAEYYPDIRLSILTSSAALNAPPKK